MSKNQTASKQEESNNSSSAKLGFDPAQLWASGFETWARLAQDGAERVQSFYHDRNWYSHEGRLDPLSMWSAGVDAWSHLTRENMERAESIRGELENMERLTHEQAKKSSKALGSMMNESLDCMVEIGREWRKLGLETIRRGASAFGG